MPVSIQNNARPGLSEFYVNDRWTVSITGAAASSLVTCHAWQDGVDLGVMEQGYTNASGDFTLVGTMGPESIGLWNEQWSVGGVLQSPTLQFRVRPVTFSPSELPFQPIEDHWEYGAIIDPIPEDSFISDDLSVQALPCNALLGGVFHGFWAVPYDLRSSSVGWVLSTRKRIVWAY